MITEINGDFKDYLKRYILPSSKCFKMPVISVGIIFLIELLIIGLFHWIGINIVTIVIMLLQCMLLAGCFVYVLKDDLGIWF